MVELEETLGKEFVEACRMCIEDGGEHFEELANRLGGNHGQDRNNANVLSCRCNISWNHVQAKPQYQA